MLALLLLFHSKSFILTYKGTLAIYSLIVTLLKGCLYGVIFYKKENANFKVDNPKSYPNMLN